MPWRTKGDYYSFKEDAIKQHAPTVSGVYGLFNFRHQILIDSAANIRVALLHHLTNTNFRFSRFEPTGFTFEPCAPETREMRVQELIWEYGSIAKPSGAIGLATLGRSLRNPHTRAFHPQLRTAKKPANNEIPQTAGRLPKGKSAGHPRLVRKRFGLAGATCGVIFLGVGSIGLIPQLKSMFQSVGHDRSSIAESHARLASNSSQVAPVPVFKAAAAIGQPSTEIITGTLISRHRVLHPPTVPPQLQKVCQPRHVCKPPDRKILESVGRCKHWRPPTSRLPLTGCRNSKSKVTTRLLWRPMSEAKFGIESVSEILARAEMRRLSAPL